MNNETPENKPAFGYMLSGRKKIDTSGKEKNLRFPSEICQGLPNIYNHSWVSDRTR